MPWCPAKLVALLGDGMGGGVLHVVQDFEVGGACCSEVSATGCCPKDRSGLTVSQGNMA